LSCMEEKQILLCRIKQKKCDSNLFVLHRRGTNKMPLLPFLLAHISPVLELQPKLWLIDELKNYCPRPLVTPQKPHQMKDDFKCLSDDCSQSAISDHQLSMSSGAAE